MQSVPVENEDLKITVEQETHVETMKSNRTKLIICALGTFVCYFYYGILQESITKGKWGEGQKKEKFTYTLSLVFVQCIINALAAIIIKSTWQKEVDQTPMKMNMFCSLSYLGAMLASNQALQHVNYPTQVLGKSAKPIPVLILGVLFARKRYPKGKFLYVLMIVIGVAMFLYKDNTSASKTGATIGMGEFLLLASLTLDGVTGALQENMRSKHKTGPYTMMFQINCWSVLWLAIGLVYTGELSAIQHFIERHPSVVPKMLTFGLASALGQMFIFLTVTSFGPLTCSIITTTRKFFTILASVIYFQNPMNERQWLATGLVFTGLGLDSAYGKEKKEKR